MGTHVAYSQPVIGVPTAGHVGRSLVFAIAILISPFAIAQSGGTAAQTQKATQQATPTPAPGAPQPARAQTPPTRAGLPVIKAETRLVLVDTVVTDKQGNYISDLTQKDFRAWEDNREQSITTFSFESSTSPGQDHSRYLVLLFDDTDISVTDQAIARHAAVQFVEANAGPNRYIAALEYTGILSVTQDFTTDGERLKQVVKDVKYASVSANASMAHMPPGAACRVLRQATDYGARSVLQAIREVAKSLASVPGRKSLILLTSGFPLSPTLESDLMAAIDECNKANVAIYPIDVRGLTTEILPPRVSSLEIPSGSGPARLVTAALHYSDQVASENSPARLVYVSGAGSENRSGGANPGGGRPGGSSTGGGGQGGGGGTGGGGGGRGGGGTGGTQGGGTTRNATGRANTIPVRPSWMRPTYDPLNPPLPPLKSVNHHVLFALAIGTGGFVIINSNDLLGGMERVAEEADQYYILGYTPAPAQEGTCHSLRVKVQRSGTSVRSRSGYCNVKPVDALAGKPIVKQLEAHANGTSSGNVTASMRAPYFYSSPNVARVDLAIEIPPGAVSLVKQNGKFRGAIDVLGLAYKPDGALAARFSDSVPLEFDSRKELEEFNKKPLYYNHQFEAAPGNYDLKVVFICGGDKFAKLEMPLLIERYDGKQIAMSTVALSKQTYSLSQAHDTLDFALLEGSVPLVSRGVQFVPSGSDHFKKGEPAEFYVEIYDPRLMEAPPPQVGIRVKIIEQQTGAAKLDVSGAAPDARPGNPVVPVGLKIPLDTLSPGAYRLELQATDSSGNAAPARSADFHLE